MVTQTPPAAYFDSYSGSPTTVLNVIPTVNRSARGTPTNPSAVQLNDYLAGMAARGYGATKFANGGRSALRMQAAENWTDTNQGTYMSFWTSGTGTTVSVERMRVDPFGNLGIGTQTPTSPLTVMGVIQSASGLNEAGQNVTGGFKFPDNTVQTTAAPPVGSGAGLVTTTTLGATTLGVDPTVFQKRVTGNCPSGAISQIAQDGTVTCVSVSGPLFLNVFGFETDNPGQVAARLVSDLPITVTKVSWTANQPGAGTCAPDVFRITNGTVFEDISIGTGMTQYDTADHVLAFPGGSEVKIVVLQGSNYNTACSPPMNVTVSVRYRLGVSTDTTSCPPNLTLTNGSCVDLQNDPQNCGSAGKVCTVPANGYAACSTGQCGVGACISGATLSNGQCSCYSGTTACNSSTGPSCATLSSDPSNCGACGNICAAGQFCQAGICQGCGSGQTSCYNSSLSAYTCVNTQTDGNNCGGCGNTCSSYGYGTSTGCWLGKCGATCNAGYTACATAYGNVNCTNITSDSSNCGACGKVCAAGQTCLAGTCQNMGCPSGQVACGSAGSTPSCVNLQTDSNNCGACYSYCPSPLACQAGNCLPSASSGPVLTVVVPSIPQALAGYPLLSNIQLSATGGTGPYTFALGNGGTLPASMTLSSLGVISGTAPSTVGYLNLTFTVLVRDSSNPPGVGSATVTIPVGPSNAAFNNHYFLAFYGFNDDGTRLFMSGSVVADANGNITSGVLDVNSEAGAFTSNGTITGTYTLGPNLRGTLTLNLANANFGLMPNSGTPANATVPALPTNFSIGLSNLSNTICNGSTCWTIATRGRGVGTDDATTHVHGELNIRRQSLSGLTLAGLAGNYVFATTLIDINNNLLGMGGVFGLDSNGNITTVSGSPSALDFAAYAGGQVSIGPTQVALSGSATLNATTGRISLTLTPSATPTGVKVPTHYVAYMTNAGSGAYLDLLSVDSYDKTNGFAATSSDMYYQSIALAGDDDRVGRKLHRL